MRISIAGGGGTFAHFPLFCFHRQILSNLLSMAKLSFLGVKNMNSCLSNGSPGEV